MKLRIYGILVWLALLGAASAEQGSGFAVFNGRVYLDQDGQLTARAVDNGAFLWSFHVPLSGSSIDIAPIEENGIIVFCGGGSAQRILGVDAETGKVLWDKDGYCRSITLDHGRIFVLHRPDGSISCLELRTGKRLWLNEGNGPSGKIFISENRVISDKIIVDKNTGRTIRNFSFTRALLGTVNGSLFWKKGSNVLLCTTLEGRNLWETTMPLRHLVQFRGDVRGEFVASYDDYPFTGNSGVLLKFDQQGHKLWQTDLKVSYPLPISDFSLSEDQIHVVLPVDSQRSIVREFSALTGQEKWVSPALEGIVGPVVEARDKLLVGDREGRILALSKTTGTSEPF